MHSAAAAALVAVLATGCHIACLQVDAFLLHASTANLTQGIHVVVHVGGVGAALAAIWPSKLGAGALQADAQPVAA